MVGKNEFNLCPAEIIKAVDYYLRSVILKDDKFKVTAVLPNNHITDTGFRVYVEGTEEWAK